MMTDCEIAKLWNVSVESLRKARIVDKVFPDAYDKIMAGNGPGIDTWYRRAMGDKRASLYVKIPPELKERLQDAALRQGVTLAELVTEALTQIFG